MELDLTGYKFGEHHSNVPVQIPTFKAPNVKTVISGLLLLGILFSMPEIKKAYLEGQKEQREKVAARMAEERNRAEFEAIKADYLRAEQEAARRETLEWKAAQKRMQEEEKARKADMVAAWNSGIYPKGNEDAYCGKCKKCKALDAAYEKEINARYKTLSKKRTRFHKTASR